MRGNEMLDAVGYVDADLIEKAEKVGERRLYAKRFCGTALLRQAWFL